VTPFSDLTAGHQVLRRATLYGSRLDTALPASLSGALKDAAHHSVGGAYQVSAQLTGHGQQTAADAVRLAATNAFDHALSVGCAVAGFVAVGGALLAAAFLPAQPQPGAGDVTLEPVVATTN
jgi:hypothetical protein